MLGFWKIEKKKTLSCWVPYPSNLESGPEIWYSIETVEAIRSQTRPNAMLQIPAGLGSVPISDASEPGGFERN